jgi:hypothetical protein
VSVKHRALMIAAAALCAVGCVGHAARPRQDGPYLYLRAPAAGSVSLVITGDGFREIPAVRVDPDNWRVRLERAVGFTYFLLVDGEVFLPDCLLKEKDDFGSDNCVFDPQEGREELIIR